MFNKEELETIYNALLYIATCEALTEEEEKLANKLKEILTNNT